MKERSSLDVCQHKWVSVVAPEGFCVKKIKFLIYTASSSQHHNILLCGYGIISVLPPTKFQLGCFNAPGEGSSAGTSEVCHSVYEHADLCDNSSKQNRLVEGLHTCNKLRYCQIACHRNCSSLLTSIHEKAGFSTFLLMGYIKL